MTTKNKIKSLFKETEKSYEDCWDILALMKEYKSHPDNGNRMIGFQSVLGSVLFKLENTYNELSNEKNILITRKEKYSSSWFNKKMKVIANNQESIRHLINLGKSLGDAYAWSFYRDENKLLYEHLKHERISQFPTGVGGKGEIEIIKRMRHIQGHFILHHSITNILRYGDFSLIDLKNMKVIALGEIKTKKIDDHNYQSNLFLIGDKNVLSPLLTPATEKNINIDNAVKNKDQLRKQLKAMGKSIENMILKEKADAEIVEDENYIPQLKSLLNKSKSSRFTYEKAGDGMIISVWKGRKMSIYSKFMPTNKKIDYSNKLKELAPNVSKITDTSSTQNSLLFASLPYGKNTDMTIFPGMVPMLWWPIDLKYLKKIYFHDVLILTIFNPIHLIRKIEGLGFSVKWDDAKQKYLITKKVDNFTIELGNFGYFLTMIRNFLFSESAIIKMITLTIEKSQSIPITGNTKIDLQIFQRV